MTKDAGLLVILRVGPYACAEHEFGNWSNIQMTIDSGAILFKGCCMRTFDS